MVDKHYYAIKMVMIIKAHEKSMFSELMYGYARRLTYMFRRWNSSWLEDKTTRIIPTGASPVILSMGKMEKMIADSDVRTEEAYRALEPIFKNNLNTIF